MFISSNLQSEEHDSKLSHLTTDTLQKVTATCQHYTQKKVFQHRDSFTQIPNIHFHMQLYRFVTTNSSKQKGYSSTI